MRIVAMDDDRAPASTASRGRVVGGTNPAYFEGMSEPRGTEKTTDSASTERPAPQPVPKEIGGPKGPEPTRYGDWEVNGRCTDF
jgi:Protein of unknown function (DUF1674)